MALVALQTELRSHFGVPQIAISGYRNRWGPLTAAQVEVTVAVEQALVVILVFQPAGSLQGRTLIRPSSRVKKEAALGKFGASSPASCRKGDSS